MVAQDIKRYNFALLPTQRADAYIDVAQRYFKHHAVGYLLGEHSLPHITVCQFHALESVLPALMDGIQGVHTSPRVQLADLRFSNKPNTNLWGASLLVKRSHELLILQQAVVNLLASHGLTPLNPVGDLYTPHMTLAKVDAVDLKNFPKSIFEPNQFALALGESDVLGQFTKVLQGFSS